MKYTICKGLFVLPSFSTVLKLGLRALRVGLFGRFRILHWPFASSMCRVNLHHAFHHHITTTGLFRRLNLLDIGSYNHNRILRWVGQVARMPMSRVPRQLLTSGVAHSRPVG